MLFELPPEVLASIFDHLVQHLGLRKASQLRRVCRGFDKYIQEAIYALPTFDDIDNKSPAHLTWHHGMHTSMIANLIHAKLRNNQDRRSLTREVLLTRHFIAATWGNVDMDSYTDTLVHLAADHIPLYAVIMGLTKQPDPPESGTSALENALAAALHLNQSSHVQTLLELGAKSESRTKWFGDALCIAASHAALEIFLSLLEKTLANPDQVQKRLAASRLVMALDCAAMHGRADVFCPELLEIIESVHGRDSIHRIFESSITSATLACHEGTVLTILALLRKAGANDIPYASRDRFWAQVLRVAASNGLAGVVRSVLHHTTTADDLGSLNFPLEDACRGGHRETVELMIAHHTELNLTSCAGAIYWAARRARYDILDLLYRNIERKEAPCLEDALCGASVHGAPGLSAVLKIAAEWAPVRKDTEFDGKTFAQLVDSIFGRADMAERSDDPRDDRPSLDMREEQRRLSLACQQGDVSVVQRMVSWMAEDREAEPNLQDAFFSAVVRKHPGILQYLCERFPDQRPKAFENASAAQSTAIFQVLYDQGRPREDPLALMSVIKSEELTRWLLDLGEDPNVRYDWAVTPFASAIRDASLTTIRQLIRHGGDPREGQSLHLALERTTADQLAIIDMLISLGLSLDARMFENDPVLRRGTPLHRAAEMGNVDIVAHLLARGASSEIRDSMGRTAVDIARERNRENIAVMIENRATSVSRESD